MQDVGPQDAVFACQSVNDNFGHRGAIGEIEERAAPALDAVPFDFGGGVKAGRGQADAARIAGGGGFGECHRAVSRLHFAVREFNRRRPVFSAQEVCHTGPNGLAGILHGHAVQVRPA